MANPATYATVLDGWRSGDARFTVAGRRWRSVKPCSEGCTEKHAHQCDGQAARDGMRGLATRRGRVRSERYFGAALDAILECHE